MPQPLDVPELDVRHLLGFWPKPEARQVAGCREISLVPVLQLDVPGYRKQSNINIHP